MERQQLEARVKELETINAALISEHAKMSVAYLAMRQNNSDDEREKLAKRLDAASKCFRGLETRIDQLEQQVMALKGQ